MGKEELSKGKGLNLKFLRQILRLFEKAQISELEWSAGDHYVHLVKPPTGDSAISEPPQMKRAATEKESAWEEKPPRHEPQEELHAITSPLVGTLYLTPAPDSPPFIEIGDQVRKGQALCIVEAMKVMNQVEADCDGEVVSIPVGNAQPVEYGETLFLVKPNK